MSLDDPRLEWLQQYADGTATAEVTARLEVALREDPALRALLLDYLNVDAALSEVLAYQQPAQVVVSARPRVAAWVSLAAAAVVVALAAAWFPFASQPWATVVRSAGAQFSGSRGGDAVTLRGEEIELTNGVLELITRKGAKVVLEAPASFRFESAQQLRLRRGKMAADVPPSAKGFTVVTPDGNAVDLGTRFGVDVPLAGSSEVHVFQGEVVAQPKETRTKQSLKGGEALSMRGAGTARELRSSAFIQPDEMPSLAAGLAAGQWTRAEAAVSKLRHDPALITLMDFESTPLPAGTFRMAQGRWPSSHAPEFVSVGDHMKLDVGGDRAWPQLTLAAWVRLDRLGEPYQSLYHTDGWGSYLDRSQRVLKEGQIHWMIVENTSMRLAIYGNSADGSPHSNMWGDSRRQVLPERGRWAHLASVYDAQARAIRFYLNGEFDNEVRMAVAHPALLGPAQIGNWNVKDRKLSGRVDEMVILGRALTDAEIRDLHAAGNPYH